MLALIIRIPFALLERFLLALGLRRPRCLSESLKRRSGYLKIKVCALAIVSLEAQSVIAFGNISLHPSLEAQQMAPTIYFLIFYSRRSLNTLFGDAKNKERAGGGDYRMVISL